MNRLSREKQVMIVSMLVEGNSIRSIERVTKTHRDTVMRLGVRAGQYCQRLHDEHMRGFHSKFLEADELWTFCRKKSARLSLEEWGDVRIGDKWVLVFLVITWGRNTSSGHFQLIQLSPAF